MINYSLSDVLALQHCIIMQSNCKVVNDNICVIGDNNTIVGEGRVGNLMYTTTYNVDIPKGIRANSHVNLTNNRLYGPSNAASICWMLVISGDDTLLENNTKMCYTYRSKKILLKYMVLNILHHKYFCLIIKKVFERSI